MKIETQDFNEYLSVVKTANERKNWGNMICYQFLTYTVVKINTKTASEKKKSTDFLSIYLTKLYNKIPENGCFSKNGPSQAVSTIIFPKWSNINCINVLLKYKDFMKKKC